MSELEDALIFQIRAMGLPEPEREYRFCPGRKFRFDLAWSDLRLAAEVEGGTYCGGRHVRPGGFRKDCEKYNLAVQGGWRVLRFDRTMVLDGTAVDTLSSAFEALRAIGAIGNKATA